MIKMGAAWVAALSETNKSVECSITEPAFAIKQTKGNGIISCLLLLCD